MASDFYSPFFPNPISCVKSIASQFSVELVNRFSSDGILPWIQENWEWHYIFFYFGLSELFHIILVAVGLSVLRVILNYGVFEPIPKYFNVIKHDAEKFPESAWKSLIYIITWFWAAYLCWFGEDQYFFYLDKPWNSAAPGAVVSDGIYWLYMLQMGFYVHCVYASLFIETIRRDFAVLMIHHFLTLGLLGYSYSVRFHLIGVLVLFVQDIGDVSLESTKSIIYFKTRNGVDHFWPEFFANIGFAFFTIQWVVFRLYWSLTKVIYCTGYVSVMIYPNGPFYLSFNIMLMVLYGMQVYWFTFILKMLWKIALGVKLEDNRETDEDKAARKENVLKEGKKD